MVTRNQHDGASSSGWWDDLPAAVKKRVQRPESSKTPAERPSNPFEEPAIYRPAVVYDLSRLAILFLVVALANLLFLLVALSFLSGH